MKKVRRPNYSQRLAEHYQGVRFDARAGGFVAELQAHGALYHLGIWPTAREAAIAYDRAVLYFHVEQERGLNWPRFARTWGPASPEALGRTSPLERTASSRGSLDRERPNPLKAARTSRYRGVTLRAGSGRSWRARIHCNGRELCLGTWRTERDAALAYDRAALWYQGDGATLNFPRKARELGPANARTLVAEAGPSGKQTTAVSKTTKASRFRGVSWDEQSKRWMATIQTGLVQRHLGTFKDEKRAAKTYDAAALTLFGKRAQPNFDPVTGAEWCGRRQLDGVKRRTRRR